MTGSELPSGVVTFLFIDVEGSTRRWEVDDQTQQPGMTPTEIIDRLAGSANSA